METDMIKITHLKKSFGDVKAVNDLSFQVKKRRVLCIPWCKRGREEHNDFDHLRAASQRQRNGSDPGHRSG